MTYEQTYRVLCPTNLKSSYIKFYNENIKNYDLLTDPKTIDSHECFYKMVKVSNVSKSVMWMYFDFDGTNQGRKFVISMVDPSIGWVFENNMELLQELQNSYNEMWLNEEADESSTLRKTRVNAYLDAMTYPIINDFDVTELSYVFNALYISRQLNFMKVNSALFMDIAANIVRRDLLHFYKNFYHYLMPNFNKNAKAFEKILGDKINKILKTSAISDNVFDIVQTNSPKLYSIYNTLTKAVEYLSLKNGRYGSHTLGKDANEQFNQMTAKDLYQFLTVYHKYVDKKKPRDWIHPLAQAAIENPETADSVETKQALVTEIKAINDYEVQFYMTEIFAMMGDYVLPSTAKKAGIIELLFRSSDKCLLVDFELQELFKIAIDKKWMFNDTPLESPRDLLRACTKTIDGNQETFVIKVNPTGESRCEIIFIRELTDEDSKIEILLDTNNKYTYGNSCLRDTNRQRPLRNANKYLTDSKILRVLL